MAAARLAIRVRVGTGARVTAADVDGALAPGGPLVGGWLLRGTLHLVGVEDYPWLLGLMAPTRLAGSARRLGQLGVSPAVADRAVALVGRALGDDGVLSRGELGERLAAAGIDVAGQRLPHLLGLAALRGVLVVAGEREYRLARERLGAPPPVELPGEQRDRALADLARRYLRGHAPATPEDLSRWSGLPLRDARAGFAAAGAPARGSTAARPPGAIPPRLLGAFDPYMLGWADRSFAVPAAHARTVQPGGGMIRAVATVDGEVVGDWPAVADNPRFDAERADVARFTGPPSQ